MNFHSQSADENLASPSPNTERRRQHIATRHVRCSEENILSVSPAQLFEERMTSIGLNQIQNEELLCIHIHEHKVYN